MNDRDYVFSFLRGMIDNLPLFLGIMFVMWLIGLVRF